MRFIVTQATAATVSRWATLGKKRLRRKYRNALTACRLLNRREVPIVGEDAAGAFGQVDVVKFAWGLGGVGWYGEWHVQSGGRTRPLYSFADLRRELQIKPPTRPASLTTDYTCSLRKLRRG